MKIFLRMTFLTLVLMLTRSIYSIDNDKLKYDLPKTLNFNEKVELLYALDHVLPGFIKIAESEGRDPFALLDRSEEMLVFIQKNYADIVPGGHNNSLRKMLSLESRELSYSPYVKFYLYLKLKSSHPKSIKLAGDIASDNLTLERLSTLKKAHENLGRVKNKITGLPSYDLYEVTLADELGIFQRGVEIQEEYFKLMFPMFIAVGDYHLLANQSNYESAFFEYLLADEVNLFNPIGVDHDDLVEALVKSDEYIDFQFSFLNEHFQHPYVKNLIKKTKARFLIQLLTAHNGDFFDREKVGQLDVKTIEDLLAIVREIKNVKVDAVAIHTYILSKLNNNLIFYPDLKKYLHTVLSMRVDRYYVEEYEQTLISLLAAHKMKNDVVKLVLLNLIKLKAYKSSSVSAAVSLLDVENRLKLSLDTIDLIYRYLIEAPKMDSADLEYLKNLELNLPAELASKVAKRQAFLNMDKVQDQFVKSTCADLLHRISRRN